MLGRHEKFSYKNSRGARGTRNLSQFGSNEQGEDRKFRGIFQPKTGDLKKKKEKGLHPKYVIKSGVSPQKLRKYRWQTPIGASICTPVAPSLLISSGHSSRLGGTIFVWGGTRSHLGVTFPECPPVAQGLT